jgi:hypothetical protein
MGQTYSVAEEVAARGCARGAPPWHKQFVTYRANGKIDGVTKKQKRIATWIDHCFASHLLLSNHVICAAGVLDFGKHWHGAKLANSMHNMLCIGIDLDGLFI